MGSYEGKFSDLFEEFGYDEPRIGLFFLGAFMAELAKGRGLSVGEVLSKVDFHGMDDTRVRNLLLRMEKFARDRNLMNDELLELAGLAHKYLQGRLLDPAENVFYIMSGFSIVYQSKSRR